MSTHKICFQGEIKEISIFLVVKRVPYLTHAQLTYRIFKAHISFYTLLVSDNKLVFFSYFLGKIRKIFQNNIY